MWFIETELSNMLPTLKRHGYAGNIPNKTVVRVWETGEITYRNGKSLHNIDDSRFTYHSIVTLALANDLDLMNSTSLDIWRKYFSVGIPLGENFTALCSLLENTTESFRDRIASGFPGLVHTYRQFLSRGEGWFRDKAETALFEPDPVVEEEVDA